jgi:UDP-glucose 4-epimerase
MSRRLILLGGSGWLGQSLLRYLSEKKLRDQFEIVILDPKKPEFQAPDEYLQAGIEEVDKIYDLVRPSDIVVHLVHTTIPSDTIYAPFQEVKENLGPSIKLIELFKQKPIAGFVFLSSGGTIYGEQVLRRPIQETAAANPNSFYAHTKLIIEQALAVAAKMGFLKYLVLRPANPFGPLQEKLNRHGAVAQIFRSLVHDLEFTIYGEGETVRDYIYIDDLLAALVLLLQKPFANQLYNVGTGTGTSLRQLITLCEKVAGKSLRKSFKPLRATDLKYNVLDASKLMAQGWTPQFSLEQGLKKTWEYFSQTR